MCRLCCNIFDVPRTINAHQLYFRGDILQPNTVNNSSTFSLSGRKSVTTTHRHYFSFQSFTSSSQNALKKKYFRTGLSSFIVRPQNRVNPTADTGTTAVAENHVPGTWGGPSSFIVRPQNRSNPTLDTEMATVAEDHLPEASGGPSSFIVRSHSRVNPTVDTKMTTVTEYHPPATWSTTTARSIAGNVTMLSPIRDPRRINNDCD